MRDILLMGPQGSGKGTQAVLIREATGKPHVSVGALLRVAARKDTPEGRELTATMKRGDIVPASVTQRLLTERLAEPDAKDGVLIDGFPRTMEQADIYADVLRDLGRSIGHAVYLNITDELAHERLAGRVVCTNKACERNYHLEHMPPQVVGMCDACGSPVERRNDDTPDAIRNRLAIFRKETMPVVERYRAEGVLREIDGSQSIAKVNADIMTAIAE